MVICRTVFLKGGSPSVLFPQVTALAIFAVVIVVLAASLYRERA
jgi:hypothetical protein